MKRHEEDQILNDKTQDKQKPGMKPCSIRTRFYRVGSSRGQMSMPATHTLYKHNLLGEASERTNRIMVLTGRPNTHLLCCNILLCGRLLQMETFFAGEKRRLKNTLPLLY